MKNQKPAAGVQRISDPAATMQQAQPTYFEGEAMDDFNSDKSLLRVTTERFPNTGALQKQLGIPLAIIVKPFGELPSG